MSDIETLALEALSNASRGGAKSVSKSTSALISLHSRLLTGNMAPPNLLRDRDGLCVEKKDQSSNDGKCLCASAACGLYCNVLSCTAPHYVLTSL
jgi:hypothetical protein